MMSPLKVYVFLFSDFTYPPILRFHRHLTHMTLLNFCVICHLWKLYGFLYSHFTHSLFFLSPSTYSIIFIYFSLTLANFSLLFPFLFFSLSVFFTLIMTPSFLYPPFYPYAIFYLYIILSIHFYLYSFFYLYTYLPTYLFLYPPFCSHLWLFLFNPLPVPPFRLSPLRFPSCCFTMLFTISSLC